MTNKQLHWLFDNVCHDAFDWFYRNHETPFAQLWKVCPNGFWMFDILLKSGLDRTTNTIIRVDLMSEFKLNTYYLRRLLQGHGAPDINARAAGLVRHRVPKPPEIG